MERVTFTNSRGLTLVGHLYRVDSKSVILMAHGFTNDKLAQGRFVTLAKSYQESGFNALAFDFSGCGESDDDPLSADKMVDDLKSAISYVRSLGFEKIALYGHSLGTYICLRCAGPDISAIVISGALTGPMYYDWTEHYAPEHLQELKEKGYMTIPKKPGGPRDTVIISQQMLNDFAEIDQIKLIKNVTCPVLIIHGNNDEEERLLHERSVQAMKLLPEGSRLEVLDGATHSFYEHIDILKQLANDFFLEYVQ